MTHRITLIPGDGIGPEVSEATRTVIAAAGVSVDWDIQTAGLEVARTEGEPLPARVLESIRANRCALKGPCGTPIGGGKPKPPELPAASAPAATNGNANAGKKGGKGSGKKG